ncbi:MAG: hypothetical protein QOH55_1610 [Microbacteriaceae bacterium]|jgi:hypothetical protein|nr:hypothetical protein [Microbacteriaceae bacterium]
MTAPSRDPFVTADRVSADPRDAVRSTSAWQFEGLELALVVILIIAMNGAGRALAASHCASR